MMDQRAVDAAHGVPHVDRAYVDGLAGPLVRHMSEPPHDALTVLAIAVRGALYEALELVEHARTLARITQDASGMTAALAEGQIYAGVKVIRQVAETLRLFHPGPRHTPGERVLAARSRAGLTHADLAAAIGMHRAHVSHVERGRRTLTRDVAALMAGPLGVTPRYLLTGEEGDGDDTG